MSKKTFLQNISITPVVTQSHMDITCKEDGDRREFLPGRKVFSFEVKAVIVCSGDPPSYKEFEDRMLLLLDKIDFEP